MLPTGDLTCQLLTRLFSYNKVVCVPKLIDARIEMWMSFYDVKVFWYSFLVTGFENAATACCGTGLFEMSYMCDKINPFTCSDASKYVFWDSFHPTEKTNEVVANHMVKTSLAEFL